ATLAYVGSKPGSPKNLNRDSDAWFTPKVYTDMAREVMGEIDLDPFSNAYANQRIKAKRYFDSESDAFRQTWFKKQGRVFMNPPYGRKIVDAAVELFLSNWNSKKISQGIVLVNNATETRWFQALLHESAALCLPHHRIAFENDDGKNISGNTRGQAFLYYGENTSRFSDIFSQIGVALIKNSQ
ncbi:MAG: DNA N-6-adenine-methyltransferase, partial [Fulvivirga sp.]|uniref:DNA N-6-adenine-methyltransferase n=1 Tax=Fulvivirga sp. TaxID=1931237 RepID=UPI0032EAFFF9